MQKASLLLAVCCIPALAHAAPINLLVTHPRADVLQRYVTMVQQHILNIDDLHITGIYHASETEDYSDAAAYLQREHITWIDLHEVRCPLTENDVYRRNACRSEFESLAANSAGLVLNGGADIPPALYGRSTELLSFIVTPHRHQFEISLLANLLGTARTPGLVPILKDRPGYAIMGICVGMQSLDVADGGTLVQDIPADVYHVHNVEDLEHVDPNTLHRSVAAALDPEPDVGPGVIHPIQLTGAAPASLRIIKRAPQVLSVHHQAVDRLGPDYLVTATSLDGKVVEGIRHRRFENVMGWQFHPEQSWLWDARSTHRRSAGDSERNFVYDTLQADGASRAFNVAVWQIFAQGVRQSAHAASLTN